MRKAADDGIVEAADLLDAIQEIKRGMRPEIMKRLTETEPRLAAYVEAAADAPRDQKVARPHRNRNQCPVVSAVSVRRMTQEEERQLDAVLDLFLREIVREHLDRQQQSC